MMMMLGFPKAPMTAVEGVTSPVVAKGHIFATPPSCEVAVADCPAGKHAHTLTMWLRVEATYVLMMAC